MCGLAGILTTRDDRDLPPILTAMQCALGHRGPDDRGLVELVLPGGQRLGLAHTRLAILDLSAAGHQPMTDAASGSWIVYNGEVYNHQTLRKDLDRPFQSECDTETILRSWLRHGPDALAGLRGMFAFALYDGRRRELWLVRDRLGVKPLYVCRPDPDTWLFASEVRALLASGLVPRRLDASAVRAYLALGAVPAPWTLVDGVRSLMPAAAWRFSLGDSTTPLEPERRIYWTPPFGKDGETERQRDGEPERLPAVLKEAIGLRMLADVPVGVFLSGGIDSSAVVATLSRLGYTPHTFSIVFADRHYDESAHARCVARAFGTDHAELFLQPARVLEGYAQAVGSYDQPSIDGINTYFIAQATRQAGIKVALSGLGGDELFGGYPYFRLLARLERRGFRFVAGLAQALLRLVAPRAMRTRKLGALLGSCRSRLDCYLICRQVMFPEERDAVSGGTSAAGLPEEIAVGLAGAAERLDAVNAQSFLELSIYLANMLLRDTDQMSMAHGLEVREPLLDHVLVETVARLPGASKLSPGAHRCPKALLVDALPAELPRSVLHRPKMGFVFPWERWLRQELRGCIGETLLDGAAVGAAGLNPPAVAALWHGFLASQPGLRYTDVLCLAHLVEWVRHNRLTMETPSPTKGEGVSRMP
jgi:asparagine synthase (glutamine-hydrolysing)